MSEYDIASRSCLKLKSKHSLVSNKIKSKKYKQKIAKNVNNNQKIWTNNNSKTVSSVQTNDNNKNNDTNASNTSITSTTPITTNTSFQDVWMTSAEKKFVSQQEKRQFSRVLAKASKSHKQRVEEFNRHLESLTEHYDIPKVSWTK